MEIEAKASCPICKRKAKLVYFHIKANYQMRLEFKCPVCKIRFATEALGYEIDKKGKKLEFVQITEPIEMEWDQREYNPSER